MPISRAGLSGGRNAGKPVCISRHPGTLFSVAADLAHPGADRRAEPNEHSHRHEIPWQDERRDTDMKQRMTRHTEPDPDGRPRSPRVGFFGLLGSGNIGNDGSFEAVLGRLRAEHPDAVIDAMCMGSERMAGRYGVPAIPLHWFRGDAARHGLRAKAAWLLGKGIDAWRTLSWVRRHDLVLVAGAGVLENSLPMRATGVPYAMFLLCASGRLVGTRVAMLSVGATPIKQRAIRTLRNTAARLAFYRSYRDEVSGEVMREVGSFAKDDPVYADMVFSYPVPSESPCDPGTIGIGIMAFFGGTDDRRDGQRLHRNYIEAMKQFTCWALDNGYQVRLLSGDTATDDEVISSFADDLRAQRPDLPEGHVVTNAVDSLDDLFTEIARSGSVVGARYHNIVSGLRLATPTISVGYSRKHDALMSDMGVPEFALSARSVTAQQLIERFTELQSRSDQVRHTLETHRQRRQAAVERQFADLARLVDPEVNELGAWPDTRQHLDSGQDVPVRSAAP
jgi:polysaccharide pyruvyl transferase WcaK-like protein